MVADIAAKGLQRALFRKPIQNIFLGLGVSSNVGGNTNAVGVGADTPATAEVD